MLQKISERKHNILISSIEEYIKDATPITSGNVQTKFYQKISTATLRNELCTLEAMGFLKQLHTSGGRIPTTQGYRYYVNFLMSNLSVNEEDIKRVKEILSDRANSLEDVVASVAKIINKATQYPTIVYTNGLDKLLVEKVKIIPMIDEQAMVLIKTSSGYLSNTINVKASEQACIDAGEYLTKMFVDKTLGFMLINMTEVEKACRGQIENFKNIVDSLSKIIKEMIDTPHLDIRSDGSAKMLENESQLKETKKILSLLENEEQLANSMQINEEDNDLTVMLGDEGAEMEGCALVKMPIKVAGKTVASIGVVGPQRMDYATIASTLKLVTTELEKLKKK